MATGGTEELSVWKIVVILAGSKPCRTYIDHVSTDSNGNRKNLCYIYSSSHRLMSFEICAGCIISREYSQAALRRHFVPMLLRYWDKMAELTVD